MTESGRTKLSWKTCACVPSRGSVLRGSAAISGSTVYCNSSSSKVVFAYDTKADEWSTLPDCPQQFCTLVVVNGTVTGVGGFRGLAPTGALLSLVAANNGSGGERTMQWKALLPPMPTKRGRVAALYVGKCLVVAAGQLAVVGGRLGPGVTVTSRARKREENGGSSQCDGGYLKTVEMLDVDTGQWYTLASLPEATSDASIALSGSSLYLLGGWSSKDRSRSVVSCKLDSLLNTAFSPSNTETPTENPWRKVADAPMYASTAAVLSNTFLLAIGGFGDDEVPTDIVCSYDLSSDTWQQIGHMTTARYQAIAATLSDNRILIVGGYNSEYKSDGLTEIGSV